MPNEGEIASRFESIESALQIVIELEDQVENDELAPQLQQARIYLGKASRQINSPDFENAFSKAVGVASNVALVDEQTELAKEALKLGGSLWLLNLPLPRLTSGSLRIPKRGVIGGSERMSLLTWVCGLTGGQFGYERTTQTKYLRQDLINTKDSDSFALKSGLST
jgi:hypothetical protein